MDITVGMGAHRSVFICWIYSRDPRKEGEGWEAKQSSYTVCTCNVVVVLERWAISDRSKTSFVEKSSYRGYESKYLFHK